MIYLLLAEALLLLQLLLLLLLVVLIGMLGLGLHLLRSHKLVVAHIVGIVGHAHLLGLLLLL